MNNDIEHMENQDIAAHLQWYLDSGVDEVTGDKTLDWFALAPKPESAPTPILKTPVLSPDHIAREAALAVRNCASLTDLKQAITAFEGCSLKKLATHTIFSDGNPDSKIMLIGDAPGADDDRDGIPFAREHGQLLDKMFGAIGLERDKDFYVTNILPWRPPGNRAPSPEEITICLPFIKKHIELFEPDLIVLLGGVSANSILKTEGNITRLRGKWHDYDLQNKKISAFPLFHPGYLLKQPKAKGDAWRDLQNIRARIEGKSP